MNLFKKNMNKVDMDSAEIKVARPVIFVRPIEAPRIIDLNATRRSIRPQSTCINTSSPMAPRSQADLNSPELRLQRCFGNPDPPIETGTPLRRNSQQALNFEATSHRAAAAVFDDVVDETDYERLDDEDSNVDWTLLDLPENMYGRLANESCHSLVCARILRQQVCESLSLLTS